MINNFESDKVKYECMKLIYFCLFLFQFNIILSFRDIICDVILVGVKI